MQKQTKAVMDAGKAQRISIRFESIWGESIQKRFNTLAKYYGSIPQPLQWTAEEFKKSLIANIERGTVVVEVVGADYEAKAYA